MKADKKTKKQRRAEDAHARRITAGLSRTIEIYEEALNSIASWMSVFGPVSDAQPATVDEPGAARIAREALRRTGAA